VAKRSTAEVTPNYIPSWVAVTEWEGFTTGDPILVSGERGNFTFINAHIKEGKAIAVNVHGGAYGNTCFRAFYPNRISKPKAKRRRKVRFEGEGSDED